MSYVATSSHSLPGDSHSLPLVLIPVTPICASLPSLAATSARVPLRRRVAGDRENGVPVPPRRSRGRREGNGTSGGHNE